MRTQVVDLYQFDELDEDAKEKAREWYREGGLEYDWWDSVFEDAVTVAKLFGLEINRRRGEAGPAIYFSGFFSQGDGACFEGYYSYQVGGVNEVKKYAPQDDELNRIVADLQDIQVRKFYGLTARIVHRGHYYHEHCMDVDVYGRRGDLVDAETNESVAEIMRDFAKWIYSRLKEDWDWLQSDESVEDAIRANEYEFDLEGNRA